MIFCVECCFLFIHKMGCLENDNLLAFLISLLEFILLAFICMYLLPKVKIKIVLNYGCQFYAKMTINNIVIGEWNVGLISYLKKLD